MGSVGRGVLVVAVMTALGCDEMVERAVGCTGATYGYGEHAALPEGFPMEVPDDGILVSSLSVPLNGYRSDTAKFAFPMDPGDRLPRYVQLMQAQGLSVSASSRGDTNVVTGYGEDGERWTAELSRSKDYGTLTLSVVKKVVENAP